MQVGRALFTHPSNERGVSLVMALMATLVIAGMAGALILSTSIDSLLAGNQVATSRAYYIAESGIQQSAAWFQTRFSGDPNDGKFVLPGRNSSDIVLSPTLLNYKISPDLPVFSTGTSISKYPDAEMMTGVKVGVSGLAENVVLSDSSATTTFPNSYTVTADDRTGTPKTFSYSGVADDYRANLVDRPLGSGTFSVKAVLMRVDPVTSGAIVWRLESTGKLPSGASATVTADLVASITPVTVTDPGKKLSDGGWFTQGIVSQGKIRVANSDQVDSYRSSFGAYGATINAGSYHGQVGTSNIGSEGDLFSNAMYKKPEIKIDVKDTGIIRGDILTSGDKKDVNISIKKDAMVTGSVYYERPVQGPPDLPPVRVPPPGSTNITIGGDGKHDNDAGQTLQPGTDYHDVEVGSHGTVNMPPGVYGSVRVKGSARIVLGVPGMRTTYDMTKLNVDKGAVIAFAGPVTLNVGTTIEFKGKSSLAQGLIPANVVYNVGGGLKGDPKKPDGEVKLKNKAVMIGMINAPNMKFHLHGNANLYGGVFAREIKIHKTKKNYLGGVHVDENSISGAPWVLTSTSSTQIVGYTTSSFSLRNVEQKFTPQS